MSTDTRKPWPAEDAVTLAVEATLRAQDAQDVTARYGRTQGIDVEARLPSGLKFICESKGEPPLYRTFGAKKGQKKDKGTQNLDRSIGFRDGLALLVERMTDPQAVYAFGLPLTDEFRGLLQRRLPSPIRRVLGLHVLLVTESNMVCHLAPDLQYPADWTELPALDLAQLTVAGAWR